MILLSANLFAHIGWCLRCLIFISIHNTTSLAGKSTLLMRFDMVSHNYNAAANQLELTLAVARQISLSRSLSFLRVLKGDAPPQWVANNMSEVIRREEHCAPPSSCMYIHIFTVCSMYYICREYISWFGRTPIKGDVIYTYSWYVCLGLWWAVALSLACCLSLARYGSE